MGETRQRFHEELQALEQEVERTSTQAQRLLAKALQALVDGDLRACEEVVRGDDEVDKLYLDVERRILDLFALQTLVASDLRLLTALLHINLHLEWIADQAVNPAKITCLVDGVPQTPGCSAASRRWEGWRWGWSARRWTPSRAATWSWHAGSPHWTIPSTS